MNDTSARRANRHFARDLIAALTALVAIGVTAGANATDEAVGPLKRNYTIEGYRHKGKPLARKGAARELPASKPREARAYRNDTGFGVFDGFAEIYFDDDADGFFYGLDVFFDVDTDFTSAFVYAALYLSLDGGPWELYYTTADFEINGATSDDEYLVQTELFEGYPTAFYDVLVEVYDADFGGFVAEFGPADSAALARLPLEDQILDTPVSVGSGFVAVNTGGGGAAGPGLALLMFLGWRRRVARRHR
ncbi:MAG: choice-of-anchor H family protein [Pseudomonadota bacterium]